ncbi:MAG: YgfZ/GcvT domain-containing protein [Steroidobacteraceae bacterium]
MAPLRSVASAITEPVAVCALDDLGLLSFRGPDAGKFLQGQLSNDTGKLHPGALLRAGLHNPQGRTLAVLALAAGPITAAGAGRAAPGDAAATNEVLALLPRELIAATAATLRRYVLRAKVTISDDSAVYRVYGLTSPAAPDGSGSLAYDSGRAVVIRRADEPAPAGAPLTRTQWRALDIAAGLPQVYLPTCGQFVAQMLNLDQVGAVSFEKGCYTGQEVIARAHYRGRVKRRMQRFLSAQPLQLAPGDAAQLTDGRSLRVIEALQREDGRCEFLAVAALPAADAGTTAEPNPAADAPSPAARIEAAALPLPYALE